ncbi:hypothetical protein FT663_05254 [Candidozyma haemuli var. vulneris]|uniref:Mitochondrial acidic protein MAM33 n=1 Tax=Candidozyma haemuli TaxID=45357 RepID=A0A2V1AT09_9ASCO|nr:hypothetical protein CXQ85_004484 [[Candida] haemuloni]KAF3985538.1 hypothetical protein FT663_05254 [[Candida] haemuloni var. vulneris]KAF3985966.1 hypothetical protein FT662_04841 [[Candida] haemuloni var. vulneris]PVH20968.1 hypothetical protein CXQ85_004484 [[Candida] haemuloni]
MSRAFTSSLRVVAQATRVAAPQMARRLPTLAGPARSFSSSIVRGNQSTAALLDVVKSEFKIANSIENELAPDHVEFLKESGFEVSQKQGESNVQLSKKLESGEKLTVFFDIDEVTDVSFGSPEVPEEEEGAAEEQLDDELYQYDSTFANVKVLVSNESNNNGLFFNLMLQSSEEEFFVDYFNYKSDVSAFLNQVENKGTFLGNFEYQGPRFSNLDESLQASVEKYLNDKGIDSALADFIFGYSEVKEEESYRDLLKDVSSYLKEN